MLIKRTRSGAQMMNSGPAEYATQCNNKVSFVLWGREYKFEGEEYSIKLLDDGRILEEISGVCLEPKVKKFADAKTLLVCCCFSCGGVAGIVIGAAAMFFAVIVMFIPTWLKLYQSHFL